MGRISSIMTLSTSTSSALTLYCISQQHCLVDTSNSQNQSGNPGAPHRHEQRATGPHCSNARQSTNKASNASTAPCSQLSKSFKSPPSVNSQAAKLTRDLPSVTTFNWPKKLPQHVKPKRQSLERHYSVSSLAVLVMSPKTKEKRRPDSSSKTSIAWLPGRTSTNITA